MDCLFYEQNEQKRSEASTCSPSTCLVFHQVLASYFTNFQHLTVYSSTAAWAAARRAMGTRKGEQDA